MTSQAQHSSNDPDIIYQICKTRIDILVPPNDLKQHALSSGALAECVTKIILRNIASGRAKRVITDRTDFHSFADQNSSSVTGHTQIGEKIFDKEQEITDSQPLAAYIDRVISTYLEEHVRIERLKNKDEEEWKKLLTQLTTRAYRALLRWQIPTARAKDLAGEFANETCHAIYSNTFPYDAPFDAWTAKILNNFVLQRYTRSQDLSDRKPEAITSLDHFTHQADPANQFSLYDFLTDEASTAAFKKFEVQEWLIQAILRLRSQAQQQVIIWTYFYHLSDEEIANRMGKTKNAIQILRHRALQRLQTILKSKE